MIVTLTEPGRYADGGNLYLKIAKGGSKSWVFLYVRDGKQTEIGLGSAQRRKRSRAGTVSLDLARRKAQAIHGQLAEDRHPLKEKRSVAVTFGRIADDMVASRKHQWGDSTIDAYDRALREGDGYASALRDLPVAKITSDDVVGVLKPIWTTKAATAKKVREALEGVFDYANAQGKRTAPNPAVMKGNLDTLLPQRPTLTRGHHPAVPVGEAPALYARLNDDAAETSAVRLLLTTATRSEQTLLARRREFDLAAVMPVWTIPAERNLKSKTKDHPAVPHAVPLVGETLALVQRLCAGLAPDDLLFPDLANNALLDRLRREDGFAAYGIHGLRSTYRDWGGDETDFARELLEGAYGHVVTKGSERAYRRMLPLHKHREVLRDWLAFLSAPATWPAYQAQRHPFAAARHTTPGSSIAPLAA
jgi:hypothetical protein